MVNSAQCFQKIFMSAAVPGEDVEYWIPSWQTHLPYCHWRKCLSSRESCFPFYIKISTDLQQEFPFSLGRFLNHSSELPKAHFTGASFWSGISFCAFNTCILIRRTMYLAGFISSCFLVGAGIWSVRNTGNWEVVLPSSAQSCRAPFLLPSQTCYFRWCKSPPQRTVFLICILGISLKEMLGIHSHI